MISFEFDTFKEYFEFQINKRSENQNGVRRMTLAKLAKKLGYSSPSSLSMISNGDRLPSATLLNALFDEWELSQNERERIRLKIEIEKRNRKGIHNLSLIEKYNELTPYHKIDLTHFNIINEWYVLVVKVLASCPNFSADPSFISQKLRKKITPSQAERAIELLVQAGYLTMDPETKKLKPTHEQTQTTHDIPSEAIRNNHKGMIEQALAALEEQPVEKRQFNSLTLQFDSKNTLRAKERVLEFVNNFNREFSSDVSDQVFQLNVQFFEHSNGGTLNEKES